MCLWLLAVPLYGAVKDAPMPENAEVVADETSKLILELLHEEGELRVGDGRTIHQPVYLHMNAPASIRARIVSNLMNEGVRIASEQEQFHTLQIEWEPMNRVIHDRGNVSRRILRSEVIFSWFDPDREIQETWTASFSWEDHITSDQVSAVSGSWNPAMFQHTESSRRFSFVRRLAEPALITGVVGVTIYLLYNVRR